MDTTQSSSSRLSWKEIWRGILTVVKYSRDHIGDFRVLIFTTFAIALFNAFLPYLFGIFIDSVTNYVASDLSSDSLFKHPIFLLAILFLITVSIGIFEWIKDIKERKVEEVIRITYRLKAAYHILQLPLSFHTHNKLGETNDKLQRAANGMNEILTRIILQNAPALFTSVIMIGIIFSINILFGLVALSGLLLSALVSFLNLKAMGEMQREVQRLYKEMWGRVMDIMTNFRTIKDFTTENYEYHRTSDNFAGNMFPFWLRYFKKMRGNSFIQQILIMISRVTIFSLSLYFIFEGRMTVGELVAVNGLMSFGPVLGIINTRHRLQNAVIAIEDAEEMLASPTEIYEPENAVKIERLSGNVEFKNVSFGYDDGAPIFENLSFAVRAGETIAFVGESGAGKSTIIDLLLGYYFPSEGEILLDGISNKKIPLKSIRQNMAIVPQEITLFNDTILNNIKYGSFNASDSEVKMAAAKAHCTEFIDKFPLKWDQLVGERGMKLSVGQKQRIAIARAFLRNPAVLILDEPTSALDANSEMVITGSIESLLEGRTTFIVAHRLSTVRKADRILVFKNGKLIEDGNHKALIAQKGEYAKLYDLQHKSV